MIKNYIKIALKVFWRHKFFTAVSLFGICFTLVVLMLATAFIDQQVGPIPPEVHADRTLYLNWLFVQYGSIDPSGPAIHKPSYAFLDRYVRPLKTAEKVTVFSEVAGRGLRGGAEETGVSVRMTDGTFWEVFRFDFLQGRPYTAEEVESGDFVAVVSADFSRRYFGSEEVVGKSVLMDGQNYRVVGVVADGLILRTRTRADVWVPVTTAPPEEWRTYKLTGNFNAAVLARRSADVSAYARNSPPCWNRWNLRPICASPPREYPLRCSRRWRNGRARINRIGPKTIKEVRILSRPPRPGCGCGC